jgi:hypothetical protein
MKHTDLIVQRLEKLGYVSVVDLVCVCDGLRQLFGVQVGQCLLTALVG